MKEKGFSLLIKIPKGLKGILIIFINKGQHIFFYGFWNPLWNFDLQNT